MGDHGVSTHLKVELSSPGSREGGHCVDEVSMLGDGVYHDHDGIMTGQFGQLDNEVYAYSVPWGIRNQNEMEFAGRGLTGCLGLQAHVTSRDILVNVPGHLRPPIVLGH